MKLDDSSFSELRNLKELDLSGNSLKSVPASITNDIYYIVEIDLSDNELEFIPDELADLRRLKKISLTGNQLNVAPKRLLSFGDVINISIEDEFLSESSGNAIQSIQEECQYIIDNWPSELIENEGLEYSLTRFKNKLNEKNCDIVTAYGELDAALNAAHEHIIQKELEKESSTLDLSGKHLTRFPAQLTIFSFSFEDKNYFEKVALIDLSNNRISKTPREIKKLKNIEKIDISNNPSIEVSNEVVDMIVGDTFNISSVYTKQPSLISSQVKSKGKNFSHDNKASHKIEDSNQKNIKNRKKRL